MSASTLLGSEECQSDPVHFKGRDIDSRKRRDSPGRGLDERVSLCQRLLKRPVDDAGDLAALRVAELRDLADCLERNLIASPRSRPDHFRVCFAATTTPNEPSRIGD